MNWLKFLFPYRTHLEDELKQQRDDFTVRLAEKDSLIRSLRLELAQVKVEAERMRLVLMPLGSPAGKLFADKFLMNSPHTLAGESYPPKFAGAQDWQGELNQMLKEEEDGIRSTRRIQEHEQSADDGA